MWSGRTDREHASLHGELPPIRRGSVIYPERVWNARTNVGSLRHRTIFPMAFPTKEVRWTPIGILLLGIVLSLISPRSLPAQEALPVSGDVLTPDARSNTPNLKIALKLGSNRASYTNDRFLDNRPFDVGIVSGEEDVYGDAAGFGYQFGVEVEIPRNSFFSWTLGVRYDAVRFDSHGPVTDICRSIDGDSIGSNSEHSFEASMEYLKFIGAAKLNFRDFYLLAGFTGSTPLSNQVLFSRENGGRPCFYPDANDIRNSTVPVGIPEISTLHFAFRFGGGMTWDLTDRIQFSPEVIFDFGMNQLNKSPESDLGVYALNGVLRFDL